MRGKVGFLIRRLHQMHMALFLEETSGLDVTPMQFTALSLLHQRGEFDQSELAVEAGMDRTNVSEVVRRLQARGHVTVRVNPAHGRKRLLALTPQGLEMVRQVDAGARRAHQRMLAGLDVPTRRLFVTLLRQVVEQQEKPGR